ncbi:MAG: hypothetical protein QM662_19240 [Gordonia sp. (in: high G+C Gram-positive bacteria)]
MITDHPEDSAGQPTWARVCHGAGCALPRRRGDDHLVVSTAVPIVLTPAGRQWRGHGRRRRLVEVWTVPAGVLAQGGCVEIGPLPAGVVVDIDIPRPWTPPMAVAPIGGAA